MNKIGKRDVIQAINECRPLREVIEENKDKMKTTKNIENIWRN